MPVFHSKNLARWFNKGSVTKLRCRLGEFDAFHVDETVGSAKGTILLIHGFPTSSFDFDGIWTALSKKKFRLVTMDMLGFGFSEKPDFRQYTIHQQADLFEALVSRLNLGEFHVVAHDYGVSVAQELLARQLDGNGVGSWRSCLLLNGGLFPETHRALLIQKLLLGPLGPWLNWFTGIATFSRSFSRVFGKDTQPSQSELEEFWEAICYNQGKHVFHNLITYIDDRIQHRERWVTALRQANIPMGIVNGSVDPVSGAHLVERYKELECRLDYLKELPTIGHYPQVEDPQTVADSILEFVDSVGSS